MKTHLIGAGFAIGLAAASQAAAAPDLVPDAAELAASGTVAIVNQGPDAAGPTLATVVCEPAAGDACPEAAGMAAYENANHPNAATIQVPALEPGGVFVHDLAFWGDLDWQPGTYTLVLSVDAATTVGEEDESNNTTSAEKVQLMSSVSGGTEQVGGFAAAPPEPSDHGLGPDDVVLVGKPDIIGTSLGFGIGDGFIGWGGTGEFTLPQLLGATEAGPDKNLCIVNEAFFRPFNKGPIATGSFTTLVTRDAASVHSFDSALAPYSSAEANSGWEIMNDFPVREGLNVIRVHFDVDGAVDESDENNVWLVRLIVKLDCDGDGHVGPAQPPLKIDQPSEPERPRTPPTRTPSATPVPGGAPPSAPPSPSAPPAPRG